MRIIGRLILIIIAGGAILAAALYLARGRIVSAGIQHALGEAGFEQTSLKVDEVSLSRLMLSDVQVEAKNNTPVLTAERILVTYNWRELIREKRIQRLEIGASTLRAQLDEDGGISVAGQHFDFDGSGTSEQRSIPVDALIIEGMNLILTNDLDQIIHAKIDGAFDQSTGAAFDINVLSDQFVYGTSVIKDLAAKGGFRLLENGDVLLSTTIKTDIDAAGGAIKDVDMLLEGEARSWRALLDGSQHALRGMTTLTIRSSDIAVNQMPALNSLLAEEVRRLSEEQVEVLSITGGVSLEFDENKMVLAAPEGAAFMLSSNRGDILTLAPIEGRPFYDAREKSQIMSLVATLAGPSVNGSVMIDARQDNGGDWEYALQGNAIDPEIDAVKMGATAITAEGLYNDTTLKSIMTLATTVKRADVGRFVISDAPFSATFDLDISFGEQQLILKSAGQDCVLLEKGAFRLEGQDMTASIKNAALCEGATPFLRLDWGEDPQAILAGRLKAMNGAYRLGETTMKGAPPWVDFSAYYHPDAHQTIAEGSFGNGKVVINNAFVGTDASGTFEASLLNEALTADFTVDGLTLSQATETQQLATMIGTGTANLTDDVFRFDYTIQTLNGQRIGSGKGQHEVLTGNGTADFSSDELVFLPGGLQPPDIAPVLKGLLRNTTGGASINAKAQWAGDEVPMQTSAVFRLQDMTFRGPGIAVSQTRDLSGEIALSNLMPPTTDGPQTLTLGGVDLSALILENGEVTFELPGDDTLHVLTAEFPWFGGTIGAYETTASVAGDKAVTRLEAANVDLTQMLEFLKIDGLSGEGTVEGVLPLVVEEGLARIEGGVMTAVGPGVVRYTGAATNAASSANNQAGIAFDILRNLNFKTLRAEIDGPLDGDIQFKLLFEGTNAVDLKDPRVSEPVTSPVIYRITVEAPLLTLINNARNAADPNYLLDRARAIRSEGEQTKNEGIEP